MCFTWYTERYDHGGPRPMTMGGQGFPSVTGSKYKLHKSPLQRKPTDHTCMRPAMNDYVLDGAAPGERPGGHAAGFKHMADGFEQQRRELRQLGGRAGAVSLRQAEAALVLGRQRPDAR